jgi:hypothetical protein
MIHWKTALRSLSALAGFFWIPALAFAEETSRSAETIRDTGVSGLWILANISYAGSGRRATRIRDGGPWPTSSECRAPSSP